LIGRGKPAGSGSRRPHGFLARLELGIARSLARPLDRFGVQVPRLLVLLEIVAIEGAPQREEFASARRGSTPTFAAADYRWGMNALVTGLLGILIAVPAAVVGDPVLAMGLLVRLTLLVAAISLSPQIGDALLDRALVSFAGARPVTERTLLAARLIPMMTRNALVLGAFVTPSLVIGGIVYGPFPFVPLTALVMSLAGLLVFAIALAILAILARLVSEHDFRRVMRGLHVAAIVLYFVAIRLVGSAGEWLEDSMLEGSLWLPTTWFDHLIAASHGAGDSNSPLGILLTLLVPPLLCAAAFAALGRGYLAASASSDAGRDGARPSNGIVPRLGALFATTRPMRAAYDVAARLQWREHASVITMAWMAMAILSMLYDRMIGPKGATDGAAVALHLPFAIYLVGIYASALLFGVTRSEDGDAVWIARVAPLERPAELVGGALCAVLVRIVLLPAALLCGVAYALGGGSAAIGIVIATSVVIVITETIAFVDWPLPHSIKGGSRGHEWMGVSTLIAMALMGCFVLQTFLIEATAPTLATQAWIALGLVLLAARAFARLSSVRLAPDEALVASPQSSRARRRFPKRPANPRYPARA
jgi:hypothetical protein